MKLNLTTALVSALGQPHDHYDVERDSMGTPMHYPDNHAMAGRPKQVYAGPMTLRLALFLAADAQYDGEKLGTSELIKRGKLARKVADALQHEKNFTSEEITTLLKCCEKRYAGNPDLFLALVEILEPEHADLLPRDPAAPEPRVVRSAA